MPSTEPMTPVEMARAVVRIEAGILGLGTKLDAKPNWADIERIERTRDTEQAKQDAAIKAVEEDLTIQATTTATSVRAVHSRVNTLMMAVIVAGVGVTANLATNLLGG